MKKEIHPKYINAVITCACGEVIHTRSTKKEIKVGVCSKCHPFFTGTQKFLDTAGRVERFMKKYAGAKKKPKKVRKVEPVAAPAKKTAPTVPVAVTAAPAEQVAPVAAAVGEKAQTDELQQVPATAPAAPAEEIVPAAAEAKEAPVAAVDEEKAQTDESQQAPATAPAAPAEEVAPAAPVAERATPVPDAKTEQEKQPPEVPAAGAES